jgi:hypothetical protein
MEELQLIGEFKKLFCPQCEAGGKKRKNWQANVTLSGQELEARMNNEG